MAIAPPLTGDQLVLKNQADAKARLGIDIPGVGGGTPGGPAPTAPITPTTPVPPKPSLTDRYAKDKAQINSAFGVLNAPNEEAIREEARKRAQGSVDAINTKFATIEAQDRQAADLADRERRASNVMGGLSATNVAAARTIKTSNENADVAKRTAEQKAAEVQAVLSNAETRSTEEFQREREAYLAQQKDRFAAEQTLASRVRETAKSEIATIAATHSYDDLAASNPGLLEQYKQETGLDETGLKAIFLNASKDSLLSDKPEIIGNQAIWFSRGADGTIKKTAVEVPASKKIKDSRITDGGIQVLYEDGTYSTIGSPGNTDTSGGSDTEWAAAEQFIADNPNASRAELEAGIRRKTKLGDGDITSILDKGGIHDQEINIAGNEKSIAEQLVKSQGFGGSVQAAKDYLLSSPVINDGSKDKKLTKPQVDSLIKAMDELYPEGKRGFLQSILPGGK